MNVHINCSNVGQRILKKRMRLRTGNQGKCVNVLFYIVKPTKTDTVSWTSINCIPSEILVPAKISAMTIQK